MQISKNTQPREANERYADEFICAGDQASFLALLGKGNSPAADEPKATRYHPPSRGEEIALLPELTVTRAPQTLDQLRLRLTNGALAGMLIEARQLGGKLTLRLNLSGTRQSDRSGDTELKRELATHFELPIHLEFFDCDAATD